MEKIPLLGDLFVAFSRCCFNRNFSSKYVNISSATLEFYLNLCFFLHCFLLRSAGVILSSDSAPIESRQFAEENNNVAVASFGGGSKSSNVSTTTSSTTTSSSTQLPDVPLTIPVVVTPEDTVIYGWFTILLFFLDC